MPACSVLWYVQVRVNILQVPVKALTFQLLPQVQPPGDIPVGFLQSRKNVVCHWQQARGLAFQGWSP